MGEGAGVVVLENKDSAIKRNAKILGELVGYGATADAYHLTSPTPGGLGAIESMKIALKENNISPSEINYINAHGTSTPYNDKNETAAIKDVFKENAYKVNISSTKSMTGHLLGAAGAIETISCILSKPYSVNVTIWPPTLLFLIELIVSLNQSRTLGDTSGKRYPEKIEYNQWLVISSHK